MNVFSSKTTVPTPTSQLSKGPRATSHLESFKQMNVHIEVCFPQIHCQLNPDIKNFISTRSSIIEGGGLTKLSNPVLFLVFKDHKTEHLFSNKIKTRALCSLLTIPLACSPTHTSFHILLITHIKHIWLCQTNMPSSGKRNIQKMFF